MSAISPTLEGFRAAFRRPSLTFAEIAWRWTVGSVAWALFIFFFLEYLDTLPVTTADAALLGTRQPVLVGKAISNMLRGSFHRAAFTFFLASLALAALWIVAGALGRAVTVRGILDYFHRGVDDRDSKETSGSSLGAVFRSLIIVNFLRVAGALGSILAFAGAALLVSFASPAANPQPAVAFILFLPLAGLIFLIWSALNWLLSLASVFTVRDSAGAWNAISTAVAFSRDQAGPVLAVSTWTGLGHLVVLSVAGTSLSLLIAFIPLVPIGPVIGVALLTMIAYFAIVDWLYIARLAGYVCIPELPAEEENSANLPATVSASPGTFAGLA